MNRRSRLTEAELEAARWIARLESSDVTLDDHKRFRVWLDASPENREAHAAVSRTWDALDLLKPGDVPITISPKPIRLKAVLAGVFAVAVALLLSRDLLFPPGAPYETATGVQRTISLADGSTVQLGAASRIRVALRENERRIWLDRGEALFDVAHMSDRPFLVDTRFGRVRVTGTAFTVELLNNRARTTVLRGSVRGERHGESVAALPHQEITFDHATVTTAPIDEAALQRRLAWREGMLAFDGETLREAASEVERYTGVRFSIPDRSLADLRIGGYIRASDTEAFVALAETNLDVSARRTGPGAIEFRRR